MTETQADSVPTPAPEKKRRQGRSPAFPFISLGKAMDRAEAFRVAEGGRPKHFSPLTSAFKVWGIGAKTGPAAQTVAALGHYGLFEFQGSGKTRSARLTDLALNILLDKQEVSPERDRLIQQAALKPRIHAELRQEWPSALPSDPTVETYLIRDRGFSETGARALLAGYKDTIAFAKLSQPASIPEEEAGNVGDEKPMIGELAVDSAAHTTPPLSQEGEPYTFGFTPSGGIEVHARLTAEAQVDDFIESLKAMKLLFRSVSSFKRPDPAENEEAPS